MFVPRDYKRNSVSSAGYEARVLFYKDMPPGTLRNYAGTWNNSLQNSNRPSKIFCKQAGL